MATTLPPALSPGKTRAIRNLHVLHDVLEATEMAGRVWIFGGLLLGWTREGDLLGHDCDDFDFAYHDDDAERFESIFPQLAEAGFELHRRFPYVTGVATEHAFRRDGVKFDFFRLETHGDRFRYWSYGLYAGGRGITNVIEIPAQPLEECRLIGRTWLKVRDHEAELEALYGDWRTPRPDWDYMHNPSIVEQRQDWDEPRSYVTP
jgi:hypothetical protein